MVNVVQRKAKIALPSVICDDIELSPGLELSLPIADRRERCDHKERAGNAISHYIIDEGQRLDRFSQTHFIG